MAQLYDDISDLGQPRIRLLVLEPNSDSLTDIVCTIATHDVTSLPQYEALSYVWGDPSDKGEVTVNGCTMSITRNLYSALHSLRSHFSPVTLWVDALCINQGNLNERSAQVQLMGDIYRMADCTLIWLGFEDQASGVLLEICREIQAAQMEDTTMPSIIASNDRIQALLEFFKRPWWVRSWIIQELCLSKKAVLIIGVIEIPWSLFAYMLAHIADEIMAKKQDAVDVMLHLVRSEGFVAARGLKNKTQELESSDKEIMLLDLLVEFRNFATTDRRDKVYALLGLLTRPETGIYPDYTVTANEAYIQAAKAILKSTRNLSLLESLSMFERFRDPGLPSWVPQWDGEANLENPGEKVPSHVRSVSYASCLPPSTNIPPLNASKSYHVTRLEYQQPDILVLDGYVWDKITAIGEPLDFPTKVHEDMSQKAWEGASGNFTTFFLMAVRSLGQIASIMSNWHGLAVNRRHYPTGQDRKEAFITMIYGPSADFATSMANFDLAMATHVPQRGLSWGVSSLLGTVSKTSKLTFDGILSMRQTTSENTFVCLPNCYDTRLAITGNDYMALVPKTAIVGDKIALMPGGVKPFLLRPDGTRFKVVGTCYVHGVMHGEVWDPSKMHRMEFA